MSHVSTRWFLLLHNPIRNPDLGTRCVIASRPSQLTILMLPYCIWGWGVAGARFPRWSDGVVADQVLDTGVNPCKAHGCRWTHTEVVMDTDMHGSLLCQLTLRPVTHSSSAPN